MKTTIDHDEEQNVATLVLPDDYAKNPNQVARLSSRRILFVKRKEFALKPFELIELPTSACSSISYEQKYAVVRMVAGIALAFLVPTFFIVGEVAPGTSIPVGLLGMAMVIGISLALGVKRHRLIFIVDGQQFKWQSKAGDFKYQTSSVERILAFAKARGLLAPPKAHK
jgi:hypothetical protein